MDTIEFKSFQKQKTVKLTPYEKLKAKLLKDKEIRAKYPRVAAWVKRKAKKRVKLPKQPKIKTLEIKLRKVMYPYIKQRDKGVCISSGQTGLQGRNYQAGHYIKAELCNMIYRYDERNINGQRAYDNLYLRGNAPAYRKGMIKKYGIAVVEEIEENYNKPLPMNFNHREWLLAQIAKYAVSKG